MNNTKADRYKDTDATKERYSLLIDKSDMEALRAKEKETGIKLPTLVQVAIKQSLK